MKALYALLLPMLSLAAFLGIFSVVMGVSSGPGFVGLTTGLCFLLYLVLLNFAPIFLYANAKQIQDIFNNSFWKIGMFVNSVFACVVAFVIMSDKKFLEVAAYTKDDLGSFGYSLGILFILFVPMSIAMIVNFVFTFTKINKEAPTIHV